MRLTREAIKAARDRYHPCRTGIHICGVDDEANEFFSEANYPLRSPHVARLTFSVAKVCRSRQGDPQDFVVDLMIDGDIIEDFYCSRQMLNRIATICKDVADA